MIEYINLSFQYFHFRPLHRASISKILFVEIRRDWINGNSVPSVLLRNKNILIKLDANATLGMTILAFIFNKII